MLRSLHKLLGGLLTLFSATAAMAKVDLKVDVGWNGAFRAGRWAPVYITAADDTAVTLRDLGSRKILAEMPFEKSQDSYGRVGRNYYSGSSDILLGVSGTS